MSIFFSMKLPKDLELNVIRDRLAAELPEDIKIYEVQKLSKHFDTKSKADKRTYYYYLPAFCISQEFAKLVTPTLKQKADEIFMREDILND